MEVILREDIDNLGSRGQVVQPVYNSVQLPIFHRHALDRCPFDDIALTRPSRDFGHDAD